MKNFAELFPDLKSALTPWDKEFATREALQTFALYALSRHSFFNIADFMGGTALRIYHNLPRYSEDLDFTLKQTDQNFDIAPYCQALIDEFNSAGLTCEISNFSKPEKAVRKLDIKFPARETYTTLFSDSTLADNCRPNAKIHIKLEVATLSPAFAQNEDILNETPFPHTVSVLDLPTLFAGKLSALLTRKFDNVYVKGRDMFDFLFFMEKNIAPNLPHLQSRLIQADFCTDSNKLTAEELYAALCTHFDTVNYNAAIEDVARFIPDQYFEKFDIANWSADMFKSKTLNALFPLLKLK